MFSLILQVLQQRRRSVSFVVMLLPRPLHFYTGVVMFGQLPSLLLRFQMQSSALPTWRRSQRTR